MMIYPKDGQDILIRAIFKIRIEIDDHGNTIWGTGFFISKDGYALTAYHNLPYTVSSAGKGELEIYYKYRWLKVECDLEHSNPDIDIAVLKLKDPFENARIETVQVGYFDPSAARNDRYTFWAGRPVCAFGYPTNAVGLEERLVDGNIDASQPIVRISEVSGVGPFYNVFDETERLQFCSTKAYELGGFSGAPVLDRTTGYVVAVQGSYTPSLTIVYASEIVSLLDTWPALANYAKPLFLNGQRNKRWGRIKKKIKRSYYRVTRHLPRIVMAAFAAGSVLYFVWKVYPALGRPDAVVVYRENISRFWTVGVVGNRQIVQWETGFAGPTGLKGLLVSFEPSAKAPEIIVMADASEKEGIDIADRLKLSGEGARIHMRLRNIGPATHLIVRTGGGSSDSIAFAVSKDIMLARDETLTVTLPDSAKAALRAAELKAVAVAAGFRPHASASMQQTRILVEDIRFERVGNFLLKAIVIWLGLLVAVVIYYNWWRRSGRDSAANPTEKL